MLRSRVVAPWRPGSVRVLPPSEEHQPVRVDTRHLAELISKLYDIHPTGGPLHVELDDGNVDGAKTIVPCYDHYTDVELDALYHGAVPLAELSPGAPVVVNKLGVSTRQLCDEIAAMLNAIPEDERCAMYENGWQG
jgi:hypothetical protein